MKKIYVERANPGNLMFRIMFAEHLRRHIPDSIITGASLPEWGILLNDDPPLNPIRLEYQDSRIDVATVVEALSDPACDGVMIAYYGLRLEYFAADRAMFQSLFQHTTGGQFTAPDELVMHVRADEILRGIHGDYIPVPISYYRRLVDKTGLRPVFTGQVRPSFYSDALRRSFPEARFLAGNHWIDDFQTTRNAYNIATSVSTFVWLAAWLSQTAKRIYMPQLGLMNPLQRPDIDLSPLDDPRYEFEPFPVEKFGATEDQLRQLVADSARRETAGA